MLRLVRLRKRRKFCDSYTCMELRSLVTIKCRHKEVLCVGWCNDIQYIIRITENMALFQSLCVVCDILCDGAKACNHINQIIKLSLTNGCSVPLEITNYFCPEVTNVRHDKTPKNIWVNSIQLNKHLLFS